MEKKGIYSIDENIAKKRRLAKIRFALPLIPVAKVFIPLVAVTIAATIICLNIFDYEFFLRGKGTEWTDANKFVEYMESRVAEDGGEADNNKIYPTYTTWVDGTRLAFRWNNRAVADFNTNGIRARDIERGQIGTVITQIYPDGETAPDYSLNKKLDIPNFHAVTYSREEAFDARDWSYDISTSFGAAYIAEAVALAATYIVLVARKFKETA
jgi:hypothetical protein